MSSPVLTIILDYWIKLLNYQTTHKAKKMKR